jgi:hypothetical protein
MENAVVAEVYGKHGDSLRPPLNSGRTFYQSEIFGKQR